jgi:hypothetical protein
MLLAKEKCGARGSYACKSPSGRTPWAGCRSLLSPPGGRIPWETHRSGRIGVSVYVLFLAGISGLGFFRRLRR